MSRFEWDEKKNESNKKKHRVSFEKAAETFDDPNGVIYEGNSEDELRFVRVGKTAAKVLLSVIYTLRSTVIRIISVRSPRTYEIKDYLSKALERKTDEDE